ncbi:MAG: hypothetical protein ACRCWO_13615, partial [Bosea sp. (in: a-proteobacteria)]
QIAKKVLKEAISNGRLSVEASYPASVSISPDSSKIQIGNNQIDIYKMGEALMQQLPTYTP